MKRRFKLLLLLPVLALAGLFGSACQEDTPYYHCQLAKTYYNNLEGQQHEIGRATRSGVADVCTLYYAGGIHSHLVCVNIVNHAIDPGC